MKTYAFLFRPTRPVDLSELPRRNAAAREWALNLRTAGVLDYASPLEDEGVTVSALGVSPIVRDREVVSVLVVQATDLDAAVALAKGHPGLVYGTEIEVRLVKAGTGPGR